MPARNAELTAVFSRTPEVTREVAAQFGARPASSVADLLAQDLDAIYLASPPAVHREQTLACARAGKHVLCEKPLGLDVPEVDSMIAACATAGVRLGTAFMMRFHAQHQAAHRWVQAGRLGRPVFARAQLSCWYPPIPGAWRQDPATGGGGALIDLGGHCLDLLEWFFGPVAAVGCLTSRTVHAYASEDNAVVSLRFVNGALGVVETSFAVPDEASPNRLELYGSRGSILATGTIGQESRGDMTARFGDAEGVYAPGQGQRPLAGEPIDPPPVNTYQAEIEDFSQAVLDGREPTVDARRGRRSQILLAACYEAARTGRTREVTPDLS